MPYTPSYTNFFNSTFFSSAAFTSSLLDKASVLGGPPNGTGANFQSGGVWNAFTTTGSTNYIYGVNTTGSGTGSSANVLRRGEIADAVSGQLSMFLNSSYTVMTALDVNANWGSLTNLQVSSYGTTISSNTSAIIANTNSIASNTANITSLTTATNNLTTRVSTLENTVVGLTSVSVTSGGIRVKP